MLIFLALQEIENEDLMKLLLKNFPNINFIHL